MKYIPLFILFLFTSCEKYSTEIQTLTLSGKYQISRLSVNYTDQTMNKDTVYRSGDVYIDENPLAPTPFDTIRIGSTYIHLDEILINLRYLGQSNGRDLWDRRYQTDYSVYNNNRYQLGYLQFTYLDVIKTGSKHTLTFMIEEDGLETLQLKSSGVWPYSNYGQKKIITLLLSRVGP